MNTTQYFALLGAIYLAPHINPTLARALGLGSLAVMFFLKVTR